MQSDAYIISWLADDYKFMNKQILLSQSQLELIKTREVKLLRYFVININNTIFITYLPFRNFAFPTGKMLPGLFVICFIKQ